MVKQTYCSKDLCLKLEKKGIDASHVMQFEKGGGWYKKYTLDVVCKWLREVHNIFIDASIFKDFSEDADGNVVDEWVFYSYDIYASLDGHLIYSFDDGQYDTYDEAVIAAIEYTIDNLI